MTRTLAWIKIHIISPFLSLTLALILSLILPPSLCLESACLKFTLGYPGSIITTSIAVQIWHNISLRLLITYQISSSGPDTTIM